VIRSCGDKETERLAREQRVRRFAAFERVAQRKLTALDAADDLRVSFPAYGLNCSKATTPEPTPFGSTTNGASRFAGSTITPRTSPSKTTAEGAPMTKRLPPVHPGEILREEAMVPIGLSANRLARELGIPASRVLEIVNGRRGISADTALRLGRYFGTGEQFWMNLETNYDLAVARDANGKAIERAVKPRELTPA